MKTTYPIVLLIILTTGTIITVPEQSYAQPAHDNNDTAAAESFGSRLERYTLLEDEFDDIPRRITRYDYLKESAEPLRFFSRHPGPEFAIFNLQWRRGSIFINDLKIVPGSVKKRKWLDLESSGDITYRLFSDRNQLLREGRLELKPTLHFDSIDETDGSLHGGALYRDEFDFILKIPLLDKSARKILFYRKTTPLKQRIQSGTVPEQEHEEIEIGGTEF